MTETINEQMVILYQISLNYVNFNVVSVESGLPSAIFFASLIIGKGFSIFIVSNKEVVPFNYPEGVV